MGMNASEVQTSAAVLATSLYLIEGVLARQGEELLAQVPESGDYAGRGEDFMKGYHLAYETFQKVALAMVEAAEGLVSESTAPAEDFQPGGYL